MRPNQLGSYICQVSYGFTFVSNKESEKMRENKKPTKQSGDRDIQN